MRLAVLLAQDSPNEHGLPPQWPVGADAVTDDKVIIEYPRIEMTELQYVQHRNAYQSTYDAWEVAKELVAAREVVIAKLWESAYNLNFQYFSGGAYSLILKLELAGVSRAQDNDNWILALWGDYYTRRYFAANAVTLDALNAISLDFTNNGSPPWTVQEMVAQAQGG